MKKVFVGLSGGVDSSVSALLLKNKGYDVTGVFIKGWQPDWIPCTWKTDRISAMRTAAYLDIPFITLDLEKEYKDKVVNYILEEYSAGRTPNPDMLCNREIKFGAFLKWCIKNGADCVATGHYAQIYSPATEGGVEKFEMLESVDNQKDQTYFLSQLTQNELKNIIFPIGHLQKSEVRKIAEENNLPVATRKDSQGICFVGDMSMKEFLKKELNPAPGNVLDVNGEIIGEHDGSILYTIGERHGFKIYNTTELTENMYVVEKNIEKNILVVSNKFEYKNNDAENLEIEIKNISFTNNYEDLENAKNLSMRIRYRGEKNKISILNFNKQKNILIVKVENELEYAHGQFAVFYDTEKCLGGGEM